MGHAIEIKLTDKQRDELRSIDEDGRPSRRAWFAEHRLFC